MKRAVVTLAVLVMLTAAGNAYAAPETVYPIVTEGGEYLTHIAYEPETGDSYIASDNRLYEIIRVEVDRVIAADRGAADLPDVSWLDAERSVAVSSILGRRNGIALYCTHSDESYEPSDGTYSSDERGSIYQVAQHFADALEAEGVEAALSYALHHPHDAGAYRRSRQTAVELIRRVNPLCLVDIHRDGIPDPASYAVSIGGADCSKIRLLVGRGNQNAEINKEFALLLKAVADRIYPGLIKDIYMGRGAFNQDLLPHAILLECGTYTLEKERVLRSMPLMADVFRRALYGGVTGSAGRVTSDTGSDAAEKGGIIQGEPDAPVVEADERGAGSGVAFAGIILLAGLIGYAILSVGSVRGGVRKSARNLREMTGGLIGKKPDDHEDPHHS